MDLVSALVLLGNSFERYLRQTLSLSQPAGELSHALLSSTFLQISGCSLRVAGTQCDFILYQHTNQMPYKRHQTILLFPFHHTEEIRGLLPTWHRATSFCRAQKEGTPAVDS